MEVEINWDKFDSQLYKPMLNTKIPDFNPNTIAYDDYWDEQDQRCIKGFKPKPFMPKITGLHYFYLNMCNIELLEPGATRKSMGSPFYRELDRRLYNEFDWAKKDNYGLIVGKPRRVGLSWFGSSVMSYELLFYLGNRIGVAAGQDDKAQDFYEKVQYLLDNIRPEYRSSISVRNSDEIRLSYKFRENKQDKESGIKSSMYMKTMFAKPTGFEGKTLSVVVFEEAGLFEDIIAAYKSTEPCFREGATQFGTPIIYGTGGDIEKGSKGYRTMWNKPDSYNLKTVFVSATDYYPGDGMEDKESKKKISFFDFRTGRTNKKAAYKFIIEERKEREGSEGYVKHIQSYPLKPADIFIKNSGGLLDRKKLNTQTNRLDECPFPIKRGYLEWVTKNSETIKLVARAKNLKEKDKIHFSRGSKLRFVEDEEMGTMVKILDPIDHHNLPYNPDIIGCDSYDDDVKEGTGSEGATLGYRTFYSISKPYDIPTFYILDRGSSDNDDEFYSASFKACVWYDTKMLLEHTKINIKNYILDLGGERYLKERPVLDEMGYSSSAVNQYGFKMPNQYAFAFITKLLKAEVRENYKNIWFEEVLKHLIDFGDENADLASAYGMVLVYKLEMFGELTEGINEGDDFSDPLDDMEYWSIENGEAVLRSYGDDLAEKSNDPFDFDINKYRFDPEYDLEGEDKKDYEASHKAAVDEIKRQRDEIASKYGDDIFAFTIDEAHRNMNNN